MRIVCDWDVCTGCLACVVTCLDHHYDAKDYDAVSPRLYQKHVRSSGYTHYITYSCRHCAQAPCLERCPVKAITRNAQGWVIVDKETCVGCRRCLKACPFAIPRFGPDRKMVKCDGCGGTPSCLDICPNHALHLEE